MTLTLGTGPFARQAAGRFNFERKGPAHVILWDPHPRRIRLIVADKIIADTTRAYLLHETGILPVAYFPEGDVRAEVLERSEHKTFCPFKGEARYFHLHVGERRLDDAVWTYPEPNEDAPPLSGYMSFYLDRIDRILEEDEDVIGHLRDPYHRVDVRRSSRHVRVVHGGNILAETTRPSLVFETGLPTRFYIPVTDVKVALERSAKRSVCPYKGVAAYWSSRDSGHLLESIAFSYEAPLDGSSGLLGHVCFDPGRVETVVDGASV